MTARYLAAWLVTVALGGGLWALASGLPRRIRDGAALLGGGLVCGLLACAVAVGVVRPGDSRGVFALLAGWLAAVATLAWALAVLRDRVRRATPPPPRAAAATLPQRLAWCFLLALTIVQALPLVGEILLRPVFPWDAWSAWMAKPKAWFLSGHFDRFVDAGTWIAGGDGLRTITSWYYPELTGWLQLWFASAAGEWNEPLLLLPWFALAAGFLGAFYAQCRDLAINAPLAMATVFAFASLPLVDAHVALAGYADLWIAVVLGLAVALWLNWRTRRDPGLFVLMAALAACLPLLKREGAIWLAGLAGLVLLGAASPRWRRILVLVCAAALVFTVALVGVGVPWFGVLRQWPLDSFAGATPGGFGWRPEGLHLLAAVFTEANWNLLGIALLGSLALRWRRLRVDQDVALVGLFLLGGLAFLIALFCFTPAAQWAVHNTAANRLLMHLVPCTLLFIALLWRDGAAAATGAAAPRGSTDS
jgi:hypothetical protein